MLSKISKLEDVINNVKLDLSQTQLPVFGPAPAPAPATAIAPAVMHCTLQYSAGCRNIKCIVTCAR